VTIETANTILDNVSNDENVRVFDIAVALAIRHLQSEIEDLHKQIATPREETVCPICGSTNLEAFETYGPTGVVAPDGGREYRSQYGFKCSDCGAREED
jgi:hypothetical protein